MMIALFHDKSECCGCGACLNICPGSAISMEQDEHGFLFPEIDSARCISCGVCLTVCPLENKDDLRVPIETYAAAFRNENVIRKSASGGVFAALAIHVLENGGIVAGAAYGDNFYVHHITIEDVSRLPELQGSKYVQSDAERVYKDVEAGLLQNRQVLFSGTPCQVAALKNFLNKDYENLITVDILCHGVPSYQMFRESLDHCRPGGASVTKLDFRDKIHGWGTAGSLYFGSERRPFDCSTSSYYYYYLAGSLNRECCYHCRFAGPQRVSDITVGDYWKIESAHPREYHSFDAASGISCVMLNTERGVEIFRNILPTMIAVSSETELVETRNDRMRYCEPEPILRQKLFKIYDRDGWQGIELAWKNHTKMDRLLQKIKGFLPEEIKTFLKKRMH